MRRLIALLLLVSAALGMWLALPSLFLPSGTAIISWWHADDANWCLSEPVLGRAHYWVPSGEQIAELEREMAGVMFARAGTGQKVPAPGQRFNAEYMGFARAGKRYIFGHYFPSYIVDEERWTSDWSPLNRHHCVADGGNHFWVVFYDPEAKVIEKLQFNGPA